MGIEQHWMPKEEVRKHIDENIVDFEASRNQSNEQENHTEQEPTAFSLLDTDSIAENEPELIFDIYSWYEAAIERRGREALSRERFTYHFFEHGSTDPTYAFGNREKGFLLGVVKHGVFIPTHFAPKTLRGGYELVQELGEGHDIPAVMSVTEDLKDTIVKMPAWSHFDTSFLSSLRNEAVEKTIVYNKHPDVYHLMAGLLAEYMAEAERDDSYDEEREAYDDEYGYDEVA